MEKALEEIKFSEHCLVMYAPYGKPLEMIFTGFNKQVFAMLVTLIDKYKTLRDFLKLGIVTAEKLGTEKHGKSKEKFLKEIEAYVEIHFDKESSKDDS